MNLIRTSSAVILNLIVFSAWLAVVVLLGRSADSIIVTHPKFTANLDKNLTLTWEGKGTKGKVCEASDRRSTHSIQKEPFNVRTGPYEKYKEGLAWLLIECDNSLSPVRVARKINHPIIQERAEVARIGLDIKELTTWINSNISPHIKDWAEEGFTDYVIPIKLGLYGKVELILTHVNVGKPKIEVDGGLRLVTNIRIRGAFHDVSCAFCTLNNESFEVSGRIETDAVLTMSEKMEKIEVSSEVQAKVEHYETTIFPLPDNWTWVKRKINETLNSNTDGIESVIDDLAGEKINELYNRQMHNLGPAFANWLANQDVIPRIRNLFDSSNPILTRGKVEAGGERIEFSISVDAQWLDRSAPTLNFNSDNGNSATRLKVSYAMINKVVDVLIGERNVKETMREVAEIQEVINELNDSLTGQRRLERSHSKTQLAKAYRNINGFLDMAGFEFDTSYNFALPVSITPEEQDGIKISVAGAQIIKEAGNDPRSRLAVYAELKVGLVKRQETKSDQNHLQRYFTLEAVPDGKSGEVVPRRHRDFARLIGSIARGEQSRWNVHEDVGTAGKVMREAVKALDTFVQLQLPFGMRIGTLYFELTGLKNDHDEYAVTFVGKVQCRDKQSCKQE